MQNEIFSHYLDTLEAGTDKLIHRDFVLTHEEGIELLDRCLIEKGLDEYSFMLNKVECLNDAH